MSLSPRSRRPPRLPGFAGRGSRSCFLMRRSQAREEPVRLEMGCGHVGNLGLLPMERGRERLSPGAPDRPRREGRPSWAVP